MVVYLPIPQPHENLVLTMTGHKTMLRPVRAALLVIAGLAVSATSLADESYFIQVAAVKSESAALKVAQDLVDQGFKPVRLVTGSSNGQPLIKVRVGPVDDRSAAKQQREQIAAAGHVRSFVVSDAL